MDNIGTPKSIREREKNILGIYSFTEPIILNHGKMTASLVDREAPQKKRQNQVLQAQRKHRKRTQDYVAALESEVQRLRDREFRLTQISSDWRRCILALLGPSRGSHLPDLLVGQIKPGIFIWTISDDSFVEDVKFSSKQFSMLLPSEAALHFGFTSIPPLIEIFDATTRELLDNFSENIIPTIDVTEAATHGYARHVLPLAMESDMVRNSLLAISASQMRVNRPTMFVKSLGYRSAAIHGLQQASKQLRTDAESSLLNLATILVLMLDDMINQNKDFHALVMLANSWVNLNPFSSDQPRNQLRRFLLDQIQMIETLVHPLYHFNQSYSASNKAFKSSSFSLRPPSNLKICNIFESLESAMAQACSIYKSWPSPNPFEGNSRSTAAINELDLMLDNLESIVCNIPPFAPGENTLVWVYSMAASRSTRTRHCAFFTSRLAELLRRTGYQNVSDYLGALSIS